MKLRLPEGKKLYPFQHDGVVEMLNSPSRTVYNADTMGGGKTIQSLVYANSIYAENILIVCPASLRLNWLRESEDWFMGPRNSAKVILSSKDVSHVVSRSIMNKGYFPTPFIISYELLALNIELQKYVTSRTWDCVIMDEVQAIKNIRAKRTKASLRLWDCAKKVVLLSGTPMTNSALDLFTALYMTVPELNYMKDEDYSVCGSYYRFAQHFTYVYDSPFGTQYKGARNIEHLTSILRHRGRFFTRRTMEEMKLDLPPITYSRVDLELRVKDDIDDKQLQAFIEAFDKGEESIISKAKKHFGKLRRELGEAKAKCKDTINFIETCVDNDGQCVVFFYHHSVKDLLLEQFRKKKYKVVIHDGSVSASKKQAAVDKFQAGDAQIFLAQSEAAEGYTITSGYKAVFVEYPWLSTQVDQAAKRVHRIGQENHVDIYFLVAANAFDRLLVKKIIDKQKIIDKVLGED